MRLLYVCNGSNFLGAGGMEYHLIDVAGQLREKGVNVGFAVRKGTFLQRELLANSPHVYPLTYTGPKKIIAPYQLLKALIDFNPDIISINRERDVVQTYFIAKIYNLFFNKNVKLVSVFHNLGWKASFNLNKLDGVIFPNEYIKNEYVKEPGHNKLLIKTIYHGID